MKLNSFLIDNVGLVAARDLVLRVVCFRSWKPPIKQAEGKSVRRSLDTAGATTRDQRFAHLVSQGTVSNCALRDGSDGGGTNANANKNQALAVPSESSNADVLDYHVSTIRRGGGRARSAGKRETNVRCRRSLARGGTIFHSPGSAVTTAVCPSLAEPKAEKFFLVKISLFGTS